jgi:hypothetical protein
MRQPKKCETLEIRLPYEAKRAFVQRCRDEGRTASEALRELIDDYVQSPRPPRSCGAFRWLAAGLSALAVGAAASPTLACPLHGQTVEPIAAAPPETGSQAGHRETHVERRDPEPGDPRGG